MKGLTVTLAVLLAAASAMGQARTEHQEFPFNTVVTNTCGAEPVAIAGTIYGTLTLQSNGNMTQIRSEWGPRGSVTATGIVTGNTYNVTGHTNSRWMGFQNGVTKWGYADDFNIVGLYRVHFNYQWEIIEIPFNDGWITTFKTEADNFRAVCR